MDKIFEILAKEKHPEQMIMMLMVLVLLMVIAVMMVMLMAQVASLYNAVQLKHGGRTWQQMLSTFWFDLYEKQNGLQPIAKEDDLMLEHNYDGIKELDNHLPPWWVNLLYGTVAFAIVYMVLYHFTDYSPLQEAEYEAELVQAERDKAVWEKTQVNGINETTVTYAKDTKSLEEGAAIFKANCVACHAADGGGGVGPNLTDNFWLHGAKVNDIFKTIKYGVAGKGMTAWQGTLNPKQIQAVSSYIISIKGAKTANPKEPQGIEATDNQAAAPAAEAEKTEATASLVQ